MSDPVGKMVPNRQVKVTEQDIEEGIDRTNELRNLRSSKAHNLQAHGEFSLTRTASLTLSETSALPIPHRKRRSKQ